MINIDDFPILKDNMKSLKVLSKDKNDRNSNFMTNSELKAVDFDKVKGIHCKNQHMPVLPKSNDALFFADNTICFIEFKNGYMSKSEITDVNIKNYDSLLTFIDVTGTKLDIVRNNFVYILVYNESKNPLSEDEKSKVQESKSRVNIGKHFQAKAKQNFIRFDLKRFEKLYFKNVYTYNEDEFNENFLDKHIVNV